MDPVTVEVIGNALLAVAEEMGASLIRSAYSTNIKERRDCSTALFDATGEVVAQAERRFGAWGGLIAGTPDEVAVALRAEVDLGAELFTIPFTDFALPETLELFAEEVLPALRD